MMFLLGVSLNYVLLDASLALIAFLVGIIGAYLYFRYDLPKCHKSPTDLAQANAYDADRNSMAVQQLRDVTTTVASEVGAHSQFVGDISAQLGSLNTRSTDHSDLIAEALRQILAANGKLQSRLEEAENKILSQAEELKTTQTQAKTDSLTQLANRGAFDQAMARAIDAYQQQNRPMCLIIFDVDHFKKFNDTHGHQAGDEVLRQVAVTLKKNSKNSDLACRYGGEEFALVMPNTTFNQASIAVERIRLAIEATKISVEGKSLSVTASMGLAAAGAEDSCATLIRRSDEAVYAAKGAGRNASFWHDGEECLPISELDSPTMPTSGKNSARDHKHADLPDRTAFATELQRRISESHRTGSPLAIMYLKVIGFASLERDYGDSVAELVLDSVGQFIGTRLREMDLLGRLERGEFITMLPGSSQRDAEIIGNRLRSALARCPIPLGTKQLTLQLTQSTTSIKPGETSDSMVDRAIESIEIGPEPVAVG